MECSRGIDRKESTLEWCHHQSPIRMIMPNSNVAPVAVLNGCYKFLPFTDDSDGDYHSWWPMSNLDNTSLDVHSVPQHRHQMAGYQINISGTTVARCRRTQPVVPVGRCSLLWWFDRFRCTQKQPVVPFQKWWILKIGGPGNGWFITKHD